MVCLRFKGNIIFLCLIGAFAFAKSEYFNS